MADPSDALLLIFSDLLRTCLGDKLAPGAVDFVDMLTEDAVMEFPYAPPGIVRRLEGKETIARHVLMVGKMIRIDRFTTPVIHDAGDVVVIEVSCQGFNLEQGQPYDQDYVSVITLVQGKIKFYRDYWNPLVLLRHPVTLQTGGEGAR